MAEFNDIAEKLVARVKAVVDSVKDEKYIMVDQPLSAAIFTQTQDLLCDISNMNGLCSTELAMGSLFIGPRCDIDKDKFNELARMIQYEFTPTRQYKYNDDNNADFNTHFSILMQKCIKLPPVYSGHMFIVALIKYMVCKNLRLQRYICNSNSYGWDAFCNKYALAIIQDVT